jgi:hypothetical protein
LKWNQNFEESFGFKRQRENERNREKTSIGSQRAKCLFERGWEWERERGRERNETHS